MRETNLRGKDAGSFCNETGSPILVDNYQLVFSPGAKFFPIFVSFFRVFGIRENNFWESDSGRHLPHIR